MSDRYDGSRATAHDEAAVESGETGAGRPADRPPWVDAVPGEREDPLLGTVVQLAGAAGWRAAEIERPARLAFHPSLDASAETRLVGEALAEIGTRLLDVLDPEEAKQLLAEVRTLLEPTDIDPDAYAQLAGTAPPSREERVAARARSLFRYFERRRALLDGMLDSQQVGRLLGVSERTLVEWCNSPRKLFSVGYRGERRFPPWQFQETDGDGVLAGLPDVLTALSSVPQLQQLAWFVTEQHELDGATPVQALRTGRTVEVVAAAWGLRYSTAGAPASQ